MTDRVAELERENRILRAQLAMTDQQRVVFRRLLEGAATTSQIADRLTAGCRGGCSDENVRSQLWSLRRIVPRFGFRIPDNRAGRRPSKGQAHPSCRYILEDLTA